MKFIKILKLIRIKILNVIRYGKEQVWFIKRRCVVPEIPQNEDGKVYVNLGCGVNTSNEYINVDTRGFPHTHYVQEVENLVMFKNDSVDLLYASHLLEHIERSELKKTLKEWYRVLKPGGVLRFGVPNFDKLIEVYELSGRDVNSIVNQLLGQGAPYDDHHTIWNFAYAERVLEEIGFKDVRLWDVDRVEHYSFGDKSMSVLKAGNKEVFISLNVEAVK